MNESNLFFSFCLLAPLAWIAWITRNNHGARVYVLPGDNENE
jgi:hypothetical protein